MLLIIPVFFYFTIGCNYKKNTFSAIFYQPRYVNARPLWLDSDRHLTSKSKAWHARRTSAVGRRVVRFDTRSRPLEDGAGFSSNGRWQSAGRENGFLCFLHCMVKTFANQTPPRVGKHTACSFSREFYGPILRLGPNIWEYKHQISIRHMSLGTDDRTWSVSTLKRGFGVKVS